jgi:hypothetical protein
MHLTSPLVMGTHTGAWCEQPVQQEVVGGDNTALASAARRRRRSMRRPMGPAAWRRAAERNGAVRF